MGVNHITFGGWTLIDLREDSVKPETLFLGETAHGKDGEPIAGTFTLEGELSEQNGLIEQIRAALQGKAAGGGSSDIEIALLTREITEYSNPTLTKLGTYALAGVSLTSLDLPQLTTIAEFTFRNCKAPTEMVFPSLIEIPTNGMREYKALIKADFHVLSAIKSNGFYYCDALETLIIRTSDLCTLVSGTTFTNSKIQKGTGYVYVPKNLLSQYQSATNWSAFGSQFRAIEDYPEITGG